MSGVGLPPTMHDGPATVPDPARVDLDMIPVVDRFLEPAAPSLAVDDRSVGKLAGDVEPVADDTAKGVPGLDPTHLVLSIRHLATPPTQSRLTLQL